MFKGIPIKFFNHGAVLTTSTGPPPKVFLRYKDNLKNLIRTSKLKCSFRGLVRADR